MLQVVRQQRETRTLRLGATAIALLLIVFRALPAYLSQLERLAEREAALRGQLDRAQLSATIRDSSRIPRLVSLRDSLAAGVISAASTGSGASELASHLSDLASEVGIELDALVPESDSSRAEGLATVRVRCEGWSDIGGLITLLVMIEDGERPARITELSVIASNADAVAGEPERLRVRLLLESVVRLEPRRGE